jgi:thiosulfate/3-mercaptopyruvate sulfurtransferase
MRNNKEGVMKRVRYSAMVCAVFFIAALAIPQIVCARDMPPLVSCEWLAANLANPKVKIIDIRKVEEFRAGHLPGAVNVFYGTWAVKKKGLDNELPEDDDLVDIISSAGVTPDSWVVVAGNVGMVPDRVNQTRVAWTLAYAGIGNVAILDGGYEKWVGEKRPLSTEPAKPGAAPFKPAWNRQIMTTRDYIASNIGKSAIVDARTPDMFFGVAKLDLVARFGHIKSAVCLPSAWMYGKEGAFIPKADLEAMAAGVIGVDKSREIIVYCDTGRLASGWWFTLSQVLGYKNVKLYDGSSQEWAKDPAMPMVIYTWQ